MLRSADVMPSNSPRHDHGHAYACTLDTDAEDDHDNGCARLPACAIKSMVLVISARR